ncbi:MAG TPA: transposase [Bacillota bacterium]|nr:transposase [Bacillota bacterium]
MTFLEFQHQFPSEKAVIDYFLNIRYSNGVICNHCQSNKVYQRHDTPKVFVCHSCHNSFSIFKNTIFEHSPTDLIKWLYAIQVFLNGKKGISGCQLQRELGVTYKTVWRMLHQIKSIMGPGIEEFKNPIIKTDMG